MKRKKINRKMTLVLESLFPFSTRDLLLVCRRNSKVIENILWKTWKQSVGQWPKQEDSCSSIVLSPSCPCPHSLHPPVWQVSCLMLLWHYIFIGGFVFQDGFVPIVANGLPMRIPSALPTNIELCMTSLVLAFLPLAINGSLPAAWCPWSQARWSSR